jgi:hypothetical protein
MLQLLYKGKWTEARLAAEIRKRAKDKLPFAVHLEYSFLSDPLFGKFTGLLKRARVSSTTPAQRDKVWMVGNCVIKGKEEPESIKGKEEPESKEDNRQTESHSSDSKGLELIPGLKIGELGAVSFSKPGYERFSDLEGAWAKALKLESVSQGNVESPDYTAVVTPHVEIGFGSGESTKKGVLDCGAMVSLGHPDHRDSYEGVTKATSRPYV